MRAASRDVIAPNLARSDRCALSPIRLALALTVASGFGDNLLGSISVRGSSHNNAGSPRLLPRQGSRLARSPSPPCVVDQITRCTNTSSGRHGHRCALYNLGCKVLSRLFYPADSIASAACRMMPPRITSELAAMLLLFYTVGSFCNCKGLTEATRCVFSKREVLYKRRSDERRRETYHDPLFHATF